jgi:hypothetical protein
MRKPTRLAMLALSLAAPAGMVAGTATASTAAGAAASTGSYGAQANAESLTISIAGQQLTGCKAVASLDNPADAPTSKAEATTILTPAFAPAPIAAAADLANPTDIKKPETCTGNELEAIPGVARLDITCPEVSAVIANALPSARALGAQLVLEPSVSAVLDTLGLQDPVVDGANQVFEDVLNPLVEALTGTPLEDIAGEGVATVQDVLNDTLTLNSTARVVIAPALAQVDATADTVTSTAHSQGIRIELLPVNELGATNGLLPDDLLPGEPLVTITLGNAEATSTYNRTTNQKSETHEAALATIEFGSSALTEALGLPNEPITIPGGVEQCILTGTPLETCVTVASAGVDADGNPYATSSSIALFKGVNGGVQLGTGGVTSGSAGAPAAALPAVTAPDLPRTGGNEALPIMGAGLLGLAFIARRFVIGRV